MLNYDPNARIGPIRMDVAVTSACNFQCCFCKSHSYLKKDHVKSAFLSDEVIHNLFIDLKKLHVKEILFSGNGEPFLSEALIKEIKRQGKNFKIEVLTNGSTLHKVDEELFDNLDKLTISINSGDGSSHQLTHGYPGDNKFAKIVKNIERLLKFANASNKIQLNYVITKDNISEMDAFFKMAIGCDVSFMARPVSIDFKELQAKNIDQPMLQELQNKVALYLADKTLSRKMVLSFQLLNRALQFKEEISGGGDNLYPCYVGFIGSYIESNGDVLLCCEGQEQPLGNLNQDSFISIWQKTSSLACRILATQMNKTNRPMFRDCNVCTNVKYHSLAFHNIYNKIPGLPQALESKNRELNSIK
jgi:MoaA/NifB/PqqE/SkfB family radical SAM enzyme